MIPFLNDFFAGEKTPEEAALPVAELQKPSKPVQRDVITLDAYAMGEDEEEDQADQESASRSLGKTEVEEQRRPANPSRTSSKVEGATRKASTQNKRETGERGAGCYSKSQQRPVEVLTSKLKEMEHSHVTPRWSLRTPLPEKAEKPIPWITPSANVLS